MSDRVPKPVTGIGWCGIYANGDLGWLLSEFIASGRHNAAPLTAEQKKALNGHPHYQPSAMWRVEITIRPLKDKRGNYIVKRPKRKATAPSNVGRHGIDATHSAPLKAKRSKNSSGGPTDGGAA